MTVIGCHTIVIQGALHIPKHPLCASPVVVSQCVISFTVDCFRKISDSTGVISGDQFV